MATLASRREMERQQLRQKYMEAATQQQMLEQHYVQKQPSPPPPSDRLQYSPPPSYSQSSYSPILRDNIYQHLTQAEQVIFERGLNDYEQRKNLVGFVECLRVILNTNQKRQLIFAIREYAVRSSDYKKFNKLLVSYGIAASVASSHSQPKPPKKKSDLVMSGVHKIEIKKDPNGDWGFNIRGGSEHGVGIFVSWVNPGSDAEVKGLKVGDQILKANDVNFESISHQAAVQIMSSVKKLRLFVLSKGIVPHTQVNPQQSFVWVDVNGQSCTPPMTRHGRQTFQSEVDERKITLVVEPGKQLGISIRGGSEYGLGIYLSGVDEGSVADTYGLKVGDQILEVNGINFTRILHSEAAKILKTNTMLIIVVKDVGKLPYSRANTQTQWHSSQPNSIPVNHMKHPSDEKSSFKRDIGKQMMHEQYSGHPSLTIMLDKAKSILSESEWKTFNYYITQYKQHKLHVEDLAIALIDLLDTTEKYKLVAEVRSIIFPKDMNTFNKLTVHKEMLTRKGHYDFQQATKFGGSDNSLTSSSTNSSPDSITQNARAILDNFTLQTRDSDSAESDDESGGIQLKSYVQKSSNNYTITPERYTSIIPEKSKSHTPKFNAPPPPSMPPTTSTPQSDNLQDILTGRLKERRKQLQPKDSFMDSSQDDTINASTFNDSQNVTPRVVVTGSEDSLSAVIDESVRREREEKMIREQREKEKRFQEAKERRRMKSSEAPLNLEDKIEEIEARIKQEYEMALEKEREKLAKLQKQATERREELDRLENERKRQSRANFQESVRSELESEIRQEYEKILKVEKEEKEQLQFILAQQKINEDAISELESKIREDIQRQARDEFEQALEREREEMQKREQAERKRREEMEEAQKRMEIERLEAEEQMRIEIEERVAKEAEERAKLEYEERLQRETAERARLAEEVKTHKEIEERLEQQIQEQKEEMERQIAVEKKRAEEVIERERFASAAENEIKKAAKQAKKEEQKRREEEQREREQEAAEQRRREEEQRRREQEAAEQRRKEEEQIRREQEAAEQRRREEEQIRREQEAAEQRRREEEQISREQEAAEQRRMEEEQISREQEAAEQRRKEEEQIRREQEAAEQRRREEEQIRREQEAAEQRRMEEEQIRREQEAAEQRRREEEQRRREQEAAEQKRREEEQRKREEEAEQKRREQEIEEQQLEQLLLLDSDDFGSSHSNTKKSINTMQTASKSFAVQEERERAEKMLQQRMIMAKQKGVSKGTSTSKEGGMSYAKQAGVVGNKGFSYAGYTGLTGDMITVTITKVTKRLGIAVNGGADTKQVAVKIKEIIAGESASQTGQGLRVGQQILQVNSTSLKGLKHKEAVTVIKNAFSSSERTMKIIVLDPEED